MNKEQENGEDEFRYGSPCNGNKMNSSLKEKLKQNSRGTFRPILGYNERKTSHTTKYDVQSSEDMPALNSISLEDILTSSDKEKIHKMHWVLQNKVSGNEEKLRKLELVERYYLKNEPTDLVNLIEKWLTTLQKALRKLYEKLPENKPDFVALLRSLNINYDVIQYDPDTDTFNKTK